MKKLMFVLVVALVLMGVQSFADVSPNNNQYVIINTDSSTIQTLVPTAVIGAAGSYRITKITVTPAGATHSETDAYETWVAVFDVSSIHGTESIDKYQEGEVESYNGESAVLPYSRGLRTANGCAIQQGGFTSVLVEWEKGY